VTRAIGPPACDRGVQRGDALLAADLERHDHLREDDGLAQGDERQLADALHVERDRIGDRGRLVGLDRLFGGMGGPVVLVYLLLVVLVGRPVSHWDLLIES
jgi:hypothetical protein